MKQHELKTWPEYFQKVWDGIKTFEIRKNDRRFMVGDKVVLREWDSISGYSGREIYKEIAYIFLGGTMGIADGYCVMCFKP